MKLIELYNKIANGDTPPIRIKIGDCIYHYEEDTGRYFSDYDDYFFIDHLNSQVDIIEIPILTDEEKEILRGVIKPFRTEYEINIIKTPSLNNKEYEDIEIAFEGRDDYILIPNFKKGTKYKGMEICKWYTLEELEL